MNFWHRLKFYLFGVLLGLLLVSIMFKGRSGCVLPGTAKLTELRKQTLEYTQKAECEMLCRKIDHEEINQLLQDGDINFSESNVQNKPFPTYSVGGTTKDGKEIKIIIADCDTISKVVTAIDLKLKKDTCNCN